MSWFNRKQKEEQEDKLHAEAADTLINGVMDADQVNRIELATGRNLRDQISIEEIENLDLERRTRRQQNRN